MLGTNGDYLGYIVTVICFYEFTEGPKLFFESFDQ